MGWIPADIPDLTGRRAIVTGANAGLGLEVAHGLAAHGAEVVLACRNTAKAEAAAAAIRQRTPAATVEVGALDLADLDSVAAFAAARPGGSTCSSTTPGSWRSTRPAPRRASRCSSG